MRPSPLTNGPRRANYKITIDRYAGARTARANLADAILKALGDPGTIRHRVDVAN